MMVVTPARHELSLIASCHRKAFPNALSTAMGQRYVEKMLEWYLVDQRAFLFFIRENDSCMGYCGGLMVDGKVAVGSASSMIQYSYSEAVRTLLLRPWLFLHPEFVKKYSLVIKNSWRKLRKIVGLPVPLKTPGSGVQPHTGLIVIGVDPEFQGIGYGSALLQEFERQSQLRGFTLMMLTVRSDNQGAIRSYESNGWRVCNAEGRSLTLEKKLNTAK